MIEDKKELPEWVNNEIEILNKKTGNAEAKKIFLDILHSNELNYLLNVNTEEAYEHALEQTKKALFSTKSIKGSPEHVSMDFRVLHVIDNSPSQYEYDYIEMELKLVEEPVERIGFVSGVFKTASEHEAGSPAIRPYFGILKLYNGSIEILKDLQVGQTYRLDLVSVKVRNSFLELSLNHYQRSEPVSVELPEPFEVITQAFKLIPLYEIHKNIGYNRLIQGIIIKCNVWNARKTGKRTGKVEIIPINATSTDKSVTIMFFTNPELANIYKIGSKCYFLCHIESSLKKGISVQGRAIIPINPIEEDIHDIFYDDLSSEAMGDW